MLNKTIVQGRVVADPELRQTKSGVLVCSFRVAWSETYREQERKLFLNCTAWRGTGEFIATYFTRGKEIVVEGSLETQEHQDKDGNRRSAVNLTVDKAHFCGPKGGGTTQTKINGQGFADIGDDGCLPF